MKLADASFLSVYVFITLVSIIAKQMFSRFLECLDMCNQSELEQGRDFLHNTAIMIVDPVFSSGEQRNFPKCRTVPLTLSATLKTLTCKEMKIQCFRQNHFASCGDFWNKRC